MAKTITFGDELGELQKYIKSSENEDAKRHLLYPLFKKLFPSKFSTESAKNTHGADVYIDGQLIIEAKSEFSQWLEGFYQALHYKKKFGLSYNSIMVISHEFCGIWKIKNLPEYAVILFNTADASQAPNVIGKLNAKKTSKEKQLEIKEAANYWLDPKDLKGELFNGKKDLITETYAILKVLKNLDSERIQVNTHNFIHTIERLKSFFELPIEAIHAFYSIIPYWDITASVAENDDSETIKIIGFSGRKFSDDITILSKQKREFIKFIETQYIFTNEGSGLSVDYYFSRFDEVLAVIDPAYVKQHGIFFTDDNLSKFALWFAKNKVFDSIHENYVVFDPAGGSGNLISSYKGKLKHKIISELQPDLLRIIEKRMKADPWHIETGFTIVPKTGSKEGLNFLAHSGEIYYEKLEKAVLENTHKALDKPLAFLLNPPYKNTKEREEMREEKAANYIIDKNIIDICGEEAVNERYLAFLGQIINISKHQQKTVNGKQLVMVFTPTSWLLPRPAFIDFRENWDKYFKYLNGFIVTSNEFFKLDGKWPIAFTIWEYNYEETKNENQLNIIDLSQLKKFDLSLDWNDSEINFDTIIHKIISDSTVINFSKKNKNIRDEYNLKLYDFIRTPSATELNGKEIVGGLPLKDTRRQNKKTYGTPISSFIGFMDNLTPVRIKPRGELERFVDNNLTSVWFRLDTSFKDINKSIIKSGAADTRSYCAYDILSAQATFTWYGISKCLNGKYPLWANQYDLWNPLINIDLKHDWYALCYAFGLAENRCIVSKFEKNNPVLNAPEVWIENPMSPNHQESFYRTHLQSVIKNSNSIIAKSLANEVEQFYLYWNLNYTKGQILQHIGLEQEPYFIYFDYPDFLTKDSGLVQLKKYAEINEKIDLLEKLLLIIDKSKSVKDEMYRMLTVDLKYFE